MENFFKTFHSATTTGGGNQEWHRRKEPEKAQCTRIFYKVCCPGTYRYSFLFEDSISSTFGEGAHSRADMAFGGWRLWGVRAGACRDCSPQAVDELSMHPVAIQGEDIKCVEAAERFHTDPVELTVEEGQYLCVEFHFDGEYIPYFVDTLVPTFVTGEQGFAPSNLTPFPAMVGCDRRVKGTVAFLGDSITQGLGTPVNAYTHWNALVAQAIGNDYAWWNLGLGFGRAEDAARDGAWLYKAKKADTVVLCFGVNDLGRGHCAEKIVHELETAVRLLKKAGCKVLIQTIPPFDYPAERAKEWLAANSAILSRLSREADGVFDIVPILGKSKEEPHTTVFGGHPNEQGCRLWAEALAPVLGKIL